VATILFCFIFEQDFHIAKKKKDGLAMQDLIEQDFGFS